jgi:hypothetical protein
VGYLAEYEPQRSPERAAVVRGRARVVIIGLAHAVAPKSRDALCGASPIIWTSPPHPGMRSPKSSAPLECSRASAFALRSSASPGK